LLDLSAASAVVAYSGALHVVADDGVELVAFDYDGARVRTLPLGIAGLPEEARARKAAKPDFESIVDLGKGRLALLGSGSTSVRQRGCLVDLAAGSVRALDLSPLYEALHTRIAELNLEGGVRHGGALVLAQRGNGASRANALVLLDERDVLASIEAGAMRPDALRTIVPIELGTLEGVPLSITDLATSPDGTLWFAATAEDTSSTYDDGACVGSIIGRFDASFRVSAFARVAGREKIEGLAFDPRDASARSVFLVADPDHPARRATCILALCEG
jgi:hypothetical protein